MSHLEIMRLCGSKCGCILENNDPHLLSGSCHTVDVSSLGSGEGSMAQIYSGG